MHIGNVFMNNFIENRLQVKVFLTYSILYSISIVYIKLKFPSDAQSFGSQSNKEAKKVGSKIEIHFSIGK